MVQRKIWVINFTLRDDSLKNYNKLNFIIYDILSWRNWILSLNSII